MTEQKQEQEQKQAKPTPKKDLVKMVLDGRVLYVHPTTVAAHEGRGWRLAE